MDENRTFLTVTLPVHPYFAPKSEVSKKNVEYQNRILSALKDKDLSVNELAKEMGYKGITAKLSATVEKLLTVGLIERVAIGPCAKLHIPETKHNF